MAETTGIEWADKTWNPWIGCVEVSPGCEQCYARTDQDERRGRAKWGTENAGGTRSKTSEKYWNDPIRWNEEAKRLGLRYKVFPSLCDPFEDFSGQIKDHKQQPLEIQSIAGDVNSWVPMQLEHLRRDFYRIIAETPYIDWLLLTKRVENVPRMVPPEWMENGFPGNIWIVASMEDQKRYDLRIKELLKLPAVVRGISYEPALGPISTHGLLSDMTANIVQMREEDRHIMRGIQWVICGGESGPKARLMSPAWARSMQAQCEQQKVPFFFKQWGTIKALDFVTEDEIFAYTNAGFDFEKKKGGGNLDGKEYKNFPDLSVSVHEGFDDGPVKQVVIKYLPR
jgi:protein gp37